ncbi:glutathione S-transferase family protein [Pararhizobium antarcticum]|uniref:Glutathione S-transferase n=1 Tax=Pararhizobium antarcticum TaxID=1798805 RepID=A0A657LP04_9HYPH|nr:glutathione S-transferase family protein [Pararhizobium antarcticum]OJF92423.1 glutathione S-transferase [Pararhizobium antarcticum]OJF99114.1 glutathione S-transferase [Rhizobium sp. 58]
MLTLFYAPGTCSLAAHIVLEEIGAPYEARRLDFSAQQQTSPDFLSLNPKGRVPALSTDRGIITETPAILAFLAQAFPASGLAPLDDPFAFARLQAFNSYLCSTVHVAHAHGRRGSRWTDDGAAIETMKQKVPQTMAACFDFIETTMLAGPWVMGQDYTVADAYLYTMAGWLEADGVDPARFPGVLDHRTRMAERPAVKAVLAVLKG